MYNINKIIKKVKEALSRRDKNKNIVSASAIRNTGPLQSAKRELLYTILNNNDRTFIIMDPKGEYNKLIEAMGIKNIEVVDNNKEYKRIDR